MKYRNHVKSRQHSYIASKAKVNLCNINSSAAVGPENGETCTYFLSIRQVLLRRAARKARRCSARCNSTAAAAADGAAIMQCTD